MGEEGQGVKLPVISNFWAVMYSMVTIFKFLLKNKKN